MFYPWKLYVKDYIAMTPLVLALIIQVFIWIFILSRIKPAAEQIFLHYNIIFGVDLVGEWWKIFYLPLTGLLILFANSFLSFMFYRIDKLLSRLLIWWSLFFHAWLAAAVVLLVRLNS